MITALNHWKIVVEQDHKGGDDCIRINVRDVDCSRTVYLQPDDALKLADLIRDKVDKICQFFKVTSDDPTWLETLYDSFLDFIREQHRPASKECGFKVAKKMKETWLFKVPQWLSDDFEEACYSAGLKCVLER